MVAAQQVVQALIRNATTGIVNSSVMVTSQRIVYGPRSDHYPLPLYACRIAGLYADGSLLARVNKG